MKVDGKHFRSIWLKPDGWSVGAIDQRLLPHEFVVARLTTCDAAADAIRSMLVRWRCGPMARMPRSIMRTKR
jgi:methylthioribose-1-phosphate isomerase